MSADPYKYFRVEARELIEQLGQGALDLEKGPPSSDGIARLLRFAHTLKGAARVVKQPQIAEYAHQLEDVFAALPGPTGRASRSQIDAVLALLDQIAAQVATLTIGGTPQPDTPAHAEGDTPEPVHGVRPDSADIDALIRGVAETEAQLASVRPRLDEANHLAHLIDLIEDQFAAFRTTVNAGERPRFEKTLSMLEELRGRFGLLHREVAYSVDQIDGEVRQVGEAAARLRLLPANAVFRFLERAARDVAQALGKRVRFEGRGGDVRVDSDILTIVQGALLQLVRNAVAHGIESIDDRRASGKPLDGQVVVAVVRRGAAIAFVCSDDGAGIDFEAVRQSLQRKGVAGVDRQTLGNEALLRLLLKSGISTSGAVTDVAGRGIGLDIVREAAERLAGDVTMASEPGKGTTMELVVPASIAAFQALLVETAGVVAAIPLDAISQTIRVTADAIVETAQGRSIVLDGKSIPLFPLRRVVRPAAGQPSEGTPYCAFVIAAGDRAAAVTVDRVVGTGSVVMRPLPAMAPAVHAIAGASLGAGGEPRLVLDPMTLLAEAGRLSVPQAETRVERRSILVVDDSLTTRMLEQSILESAGYDVELASSGEEGLEKARVGGYALFLVDVEMPGMDGFTFIERAGADPALRGTPAILVTSRAAAEDRQRGRDVGAQGYIVKGDFDQGVLLEQIRRLVQ